MRKVTKDEMVDLEIKLEEHELKNIYWLFDAQRLGRDEYISAEEFQYVPKDLQNQVKAAILTGTAITGHIDELEEEAGNEKSK